MKKLLRATRAWLLRPVTQQLDALSLELAAAKRDQAALVSDAIRGAAIPYLDEIEAHLAAHQLGLEDTIELIRDERLSFARFGDGEFKSMLRSNYNLRFQPSSPELARSLKQVFVSGQGTSSNLLVGFPTLYRDLHWSRVWIDIWPEIRALLGEHQRFGNSHVSRPICFQALGRKGVELWRSVWDKRDIVVITGKDSRMTLIPELFDNALSIDRIDSTPVDAFRDIDRVIDEMEKHRGENKLFLIALGPAGTVLAHRAALMDEQAIDIGHISDSYETVFHGEAWPESKPLTRASDS